MISLIYLLIGIMLICIIGGVVWLMTIIFGERKKEEDVPIALNFLSGVDSGVFIGTEVSTVPAKDRRRIVEIEPKDVSINETNPIINVKIIVDKNKTIVCPKGTLSKDRNINIHLPPKSSDFPIALKDNIFGKALMWATELKNLQNLEIEMLEEGGIRKDELLKKIGMGEISREFMKFTDEIVKDALESVIAAKDSKNKGSSSTPLIPPKQNE